MINEAIQNTPYRLGPYLHQRKKELSKISKDLEEANSILEKSNGLGFLRTFLKYGGVDHEIASEAIYGLPYLIARPTDVVPAKEMIENIESWIKFGSQYKFQDYLFDWLNNAKPLRDTLRASILSLKHAEDGMREYGYIEGDPSNLEDHEYLDANEALKALRNGGAALLAGEKIVTDMYKKIKAYRDYVANFAYTDRWRPNHDAVETLYHASIFVPELLRDGFQTIRPDGRRGAGNFGIQDTISVTHELEIARNLMRSFKELWMITHGQIQKKDILSWIKEEKINSSLIRPNTNTLELYKIWQAHTKTRENPVIINMGELVNVLKSRSLTDIGVISCDVQLDGSEEYLYAEREFRVKPEKINNIKRIF